MDSGYGAVFFFSFGGVGWDAVSFYGLGNFIGWVSQVAE